MANFDCPKWDASKGVEYFRTTEPDSVTNLDPTSNSFFATFLVNQGKWKTSSDTPSYFRYLESVSYSIFDFEKVLKDIHIIKKLPIGTTGSSNSVCLVRKSARLQTENKMSSCALSWRKGSLETTRRPPGSTIPVVDFQFFCTPELGRTFEMNSLATFEQRKKANGKRFLGIQTLMKGMVDSKFIPVAILERLLSTEFVTETGSKPVVEVVNHHEYRPGVEVITLALYTLSGAILSLVNLWAIRDVFGLHPMSVGPTFFQNKGSTLLLFNADIRRFGLYCEGTGELKARVKLKGQIRDISISSFMSSRMSTNFTSSTRGETYFSSIGWNFFSWNQNDQASTYPSPLYSVTAPAYKLGGDWLSKAISSKGACDHLIQALIKYETVRSKGRIPPEEEVEKIKITIANRCQAPVDEDHAVKYGSPGGSVFSLKNFHVDNSKAKRAWEAIDFGNYGVGVIPIRPTFAEDRLESLLEESGGRLMHHDLPIWVSSWRGVIAGGQVSEETGQFLDEILIKSVSRPGWVSQL